jgi:Protein of unknown function (DUF2829)
MDFSAALMLIRRGGIAARASWSGSGLALGIMAPPAESNIMPFVAVRSSDGRLMAWQPSQQEMFADDWYEVSSGEVAGHG